MGVNPRSFIGLIKYPILTEKTVELLQKNQYSFAVDPKSDKPSMLCSNLERACHSKLPDKTYEIETLLNQSSSVYTERVWMLSIHYKDLCCQLT